MVNTWHYQLMRHKDGYLAVHEFYPSDHGGGSWTEEPVCIGGNDINDVKKAIQIILNDIDKHGVIDYE